VVVPGDEGELQEAVSNGALTDRKQINVWAGHLVGSVVEILMIQNYNYHHLERTLLQKLYILILFFLKSDQNKAHNNISMS